MLVLIVILFSMFFTRVNNLISPYKPPNYKKSIL